MVTFVSCSLLPQAVRSSPSANFKVTLGAYLDLVILDNCSSMRRAVVPKRCRFARLPAITYPYAPRFGTVMDRLDHRLHESP